MKNYLLLLLTTSILSAPTNFTPIQKAAQEAFEATRTSSADTALLASHLRDLSMAGHDVQPQAALAHTSLSKMIRNVKNYPSEWVSSNYWALKLYKDTRLLKDPKVWKFLEDDRRAAWIYVRLSKMPNVNQETLEAVRTAALARFDQVRDTDGIAQKLLLYRDNNLLEFVASSKYYLEIFQDPFKASLLKAFVRPSWNHQSFFNNLAKAANRDYNSQDQVLKSVNDITFSQYYLKLMEFPSFQRYISDMDRALPLYKALQQQKNPQLESNLLPVLKLTILPSIFARGGLTSKESRQLLNYYFKTVLKNQFGISNHFLNFLVRIQGISG